MPTPTKASTPSPHQPRRHRVVLWCVVGVVVATIVAVETRRFLPRPVPRVIWDAATASAPLPGFKFLMFPASADVPVFAAEGVPTQDPVLRALCNSQWELDAARRTALPSPRTNAVSPTGGMVVFTAAQGERYVRLADLRFSPPPADGRDYLAAFERSYRIRKYHEFESADLNLHTTPRGQDVLLTFVFKEYVEEYQYWVDHEGVEHATLHRILVGRGSPWRGILHAVYSIALALMVTPIILLALRATVLRPRA